MESYYRYREQQQAIDEIAEKRGVVVFRPDYHGKQSDLNTVLFYLPEDAAHNRAVDKEIFRYSNGDAQDLMRTQKREIPQKFIYRDPLWSFENSDANGRGSYDFANFGKVDLLGLQWKERLEGHIRFALIKKRQLQYVAEAGGWLALTEADDTQNDFNRSLIDAMKMAYGTAFVGNINIYNDRLEIAEGKKSVYTEYIGQKVYNSECSFCLPAADKELEQMIRNWNFGGQSSDKPVTADAIIGRIGKVGGIDLIWR